MRQKNRVQRLRDFWWRHERPRREMWQRARRPVPVYRHAHASPSIGCSYGWTHASVPDHRIDCHRPGRRRHVRHSAQPVSRGVVAPPRHQWLGKGNDPRYTPTTTFETFSFPDGLWPDIPADADAADPRAIAIAEAARRLVELRDRWLHPPEWVEWVEEPVTGLSQATCSA